MSSTTPASDDQQQPVVTYFPHFNREPTREQMEEAERYATSHPVSYELRQDGSRHGMTDLQICLHIAITVALAPFSLPQPLDVNGLIYHQLKRGLTTGKYICGCNPFTCRHTCRADAATAFLRGWLDERAIPSREVWVFSPCSGPTGKGEVNELAFKRGIALAPEEEEDYSGTMIACALWEYGLTIEGAPELVGELRLLLEDMARPDGEMALEACGDEGAVMARRLIERYLRELEGCFVCSGCGVSVCCRKPEGEV